MSAIFDASREGQELELRLISDQVMGGVSRGSLSREEVAGRLAARMTGDVRLENGGGFIQIAGDLPKRVRRARGLVIQVFGNGETYGCHLRTTDVARPWQSFRQAFSAPAEWTRVELPFEAFTPHRIDAPLRVEALTRIGLIGIGRAFHADLAVSRIALLQ